MKKLMLFLTLNLFFITCFNAMKLEKAMSAQKASSKDDTDDSLASRDAIVAERESTMKKLRDAQKEITRRMSDAATAQVVKGVTGQQTGYKKMSGYEKFGSVDDLQRSALKLNDLLRRAEEGDKEAEKELDTELAKTKQEQEEKQANKEGKAEAVATQQEQAQGANETQTEAESTVLVGGQEVSRQRALTDYSLYQGQSTEAIRKSYPYATTPRGNFEW